MNPFDDVNEIEEFDWFPEDGIPDDYENIVDLKDSVNSESTAEVNGNQYEYGDIEDDIHMWHYADGLQESMNSVSNCVFKKMCGAELEVNSRYIDYYTEKLGERAVLFQSSFGGESNPELNGMELEAKIKACLLENGSVVAAISNDSWKSMRYDEETAFFDDGLRVIQIIGMRKNEIVINDFNDKNGMGIGITSKEFSKMNGILLEVYK